MSNKDAAISRAEWRIELAKFVLSHVPECSLDRSEIVRRIALGLHRAHYEGLQNAAMLARDIAEVRDRSYREVIISISDAIDALSAKNEADIRRIYDFPPSEVDAG